MRTVIIIGGGASGMAAAFSASKKGNKVILLEKNEKLGKKIFITGKGRCNLTNASDLEEYFPNIISNPKFLYSALYSFTNQDVCDLLEENGCPVKTERGNRVFPVSDHSSDVIRAFERAIRNNGVEIRLQTKVKGLLTSQNMDTKNFTVKGVELSNGETLYGDAVIVATGGISYASTGSTGDGYRFAKDTGLVVTDIFPALVPFETEETFVSELSGLSLKNVTLSINDRGKEIFNDFGEMLFTHFGISGPLVLTASSKITKKLDHEMKAFIDLKPALSVQELDKRILRDFNEQINKSLKNALDKLLPKSLIPIIISLSGINPEKKLNEVSKEERAMLVKTLKAMPLTITGTRPFSEAIITQGGVSVKEIDPSTMECKNVSGLYFVGEVLDIDALTGGYNLQLAWSTGYLAGMNV